MNCSEYQVGYSRDLYNTPIAVGYSPPKGFPGGKETILVVIGRGPHVKEKALPAKQILDFRPHVFHDAVVEGVLKTAKIEQEPRGWFERKCKEADCEWFIPMVKRMAAGELVPLEEIQAAYFAYNGKPMPCGKWSELFL